MARDHGRVLCRIWTDAKFLARSEPAQRLYLLLLSQPTVNNAGVQPLLIGKWARKGPTGDIEGIQKSLRELEEHDYVVTDHETEELLIRSYIRNDGGMKHRYIMKNALGCAKAVESPVLRSVLARELRRLGRDDAVEAATSIEADLQSIDAIPMPAKPDSDAVVIPSESHSERIETAPSESMALESHSDPIEITRVKVKVSSKGSVSTDSSSKDENTPSPHTARTIAKTDAGFDEFWSNYPRKVGKDDARKAYMRALKRASADEVLAGTVRLANDPNLPTDRQFIPHPATWLNGGRWDDEPLPPDKPLPLRYSRPNPDDRAASVTAIAEQARAARQSTGGHS